MSFRSDKTRHYYVAQYVVLQAASVAPRSNVSRKSDTRLPLTHHHLSPPHDIPHCIDRLEHRLRRQVRVAHRHLRIVVTQQFLHLVPLGQCQSDAPDPAHGRLLAAVADPAGDTPDRRSGQSRVYNPTPAAAQGCCPRHGKRHPHPRRVRFSLSRRRSAARHCSRAQACTDVAGAAARPKARTHALQSEKPIDPNAVKQTPAILRARAKPTAAAQAPSSLQPHRHE